MTYIDILSKLISFDTTTSIDTLDAVYWVKDYLEKCGMRVHLVYNPAKTRASLVGAYTGNLSDKQIVFCGHLDVVPADMEQWLTNPFELTEKNGVLYGRGTADMKGGIAVLLSLVPTFIERNKNFAVVLTHNEEIAGDSIQEVLNDTESQRILTGAKGCIVMEPTLSRIVLGHKSATCGSIAVKGKSAHSSNPTLGVNALAHAIAIYNLFYTVANPFKKRSDDAYEVPHAVADILVLKSGTAINIIPDFATFTYSCRFLSEKTERVFLNEMEKAIVDYVDGIDGLSVEFGHKMHLPALENSENDSFVQEALTCFSFAAYKKVSYATEAGHMAQFGISTIVCGPGNIDNAHQHNEYVTRDQLSDYYTRLDKLMA